MHFYQFLLLKTTVQIHAFPDKCALIISLTFQLERRYWVGNSIQWIVAISGKRKLLFRYDIDWSNFMSIVRTFVVGVFTTNQYAFVLCLISTLECVVWHVKSTFNYHNQRVNVTEWGHSSCSSVTRSNKFHGFGYFSYRLQHSQQLFIFGCNWLRGFVITNLVLNWYD